MEHEKKLTPMNELTDDELEGIAGGTDATTKMLECFECEQKVQHELRGITWYCTVCGRPYSSPLLRPVITR